MKKFSFLIILTALGLFGSAFFGIYTAPGLEEFPTAKSLGLKNTFLKSKEGSASKTTSKAKAKTTGGTIEPVERPVGVFNTDPNGATARRNAYLHQSEDKVAPKRK